MPVAGSTHELQTGTGPAREWFLKVAGTINTRIAKHETAQGFYVVGADGRAHGFNNNRSVERVKQFLDSSLKAYSAILPAKVEVSESELAAMEGRRPDTGTSTIRVYSRIRPIPTGSHPANENVAQDHLWITPDDARVIGETSKFPRSLAGRIVRFHLVDNVRGEPDHWQPAEVRVADFSLKQLEGSGASRLFEFTGIYAASTLNGQRGIEGTISGRFSIASDVGRIQEFKAFGDAKVWGRSTYTPNPPTGMFPVVFAFVQVDDEIARSVPPQAIFYGRSYFEPQVP